MRTTSRFLGAALAAALLAACSGGSSIPVASGGSGTSGSSNVRFPIVSPFALRDDAGRVVNERTHVFPTREAAAGFAPMRGRHGSNLNYYGGPVQTTPHIAVVYWGFGTYGDPNGVQSDESNFLNNVEACCTYNKWINIVTQYTQSGGAHITDNTGGISCSWNDNTNAVPSQPTDAQIQAEAQNLAAHCGSHDQNTSFVVSTPHGHNTSGFATQWCAYHGYTSGYSTNISYTDMPYMPDGGASCGANFINSGSGGTDDGVSVVGGHELAETQTDPQAGNGWLDSSGNEIGDKCAWSSASKDLSFGGSTLGTNYFPVQPLWDNAITGCATSGP
ncbi:MAG: hypothetical protein JOY98_05710 [Candidatus Eremiobacteraeota bacterium]|nr:hypothetical protein [Candidatus Eremiobacteraeota bacterium]